MEASVESIHSLRIRPNGRCSRARRERLQVRTLERSRSHAESSIVNQWSVAFGASMSRTLTISDELYTRLESEARSRGLATVEELLNRFQTLDEDIDRRKEVVREIDCLRERLFRRYGEMPDSIELLREDRGR